MESKKTSDTFPIILASTVHDIKNSLGTLLGLIRQLADNQQVKSSDEFVSLEFEATRINHSLMQLLIMYKIEYHKFSLAIDEYTVVDIINEVIAQNHNLSRINGLNLQVECDDELMVYCDFAHVSNALGTILNNAQRYTQQSINISVVQEVDYLKFTIEDDGIGYPQHMLQAELINPTDLDWVTGNTGLGLYFVAAIAALHTANGKNGWVKIDNQSRLGGARFSLYLP